MIEFAFAAGLTLVSSIFPYMLGFVQTLSWLEVAGVFANFFCVILATRQKVMTWPVGIVAVILLGVLFWQLGLYASMALSIGYFLPVQFYGWWKWKYGGEDKTELPVTWMNVTDYGVYSVFGVTMFVGILALNLFFGGALAWLDTAILTFSVLAQQLMAVKKAESWLGWIVVNIVSIVVYGLAGAPILAMQYGFFLINAIYGFVLWKKSIN